MKTFMKVLNMKSIWTKPVSVENGTILEIEPCVEVVGKFYFVDPLDSEIHLRDIYGTTVWMTDNDVKNGYLEEASEVVEQKADDNVQTIAFADSKNIASMVYLKKEQILVVVFCYGGVYSYLDVPQSLVTELASCKSVGSLFAKSVKDNYPTTRIR